MKIDEYGFYADIEPTILFEDDYILVVVKPCKMHTTKNTVDDNNTLTDFICSLYPEVANVHGFSHHEAGCLHRLDFDTSGLVLFAKSDLAFQDFRCLMTQNGIQKQYIALSLHSEIEVEGAKPAWYPEKNTFETMLLSQKTCDFDNFCIQSCFRNFGNGSKRVAPFTQNSDFKKKKEDSPLYTTQIISTDQYFSKILFNVKITNGFRHQIRCHLAWLGFPICGDQLYNGSNSDRLYLQAVSLNFQHPFTQVNMNISMI